MGRLIEGASAPFAFSGHVRYVANLLKQQRSPVYAAQYVVNNVNVEHRDIMYRQLWAFVTPESVKDLREAVKMITK